MNKVINFINIEKKNNQSVILSDEEKMVITLKYGVPDGEMLAVLQIANLMGLTTREVCQIENQALKKLRSIPCIQKFKDLIN